jgi:hypothetical protein
MNMACHLVKPNPNVTPIRSSILIPDTTTIPHPHSSFPSHSPLIERSGPVIKPSHSIKTTFLAVQVPRYFLSKCYASLTQVDLPTGSEASRLEHHILRTKRKSIKTLTSITDLLYLYPTNLHSDTSNTYHILEEIHVVGIRLFFEPKR